MFSVHTRSADRPIHEDESRLPLRGMKPGYWGAGINYIGVSGRKYEAGWNFRKGQHIACDRRLRDRETELEQFTMNVWCTPEVICTAHRADDRRDASG